MEKEVVIKDSTMPALYKAFAAFQKDLTIIEKTGEVDAGKFKFKYAPLDEIMKTVYPLLSKNGLSIRHELNEGGVEAILTHEDGAELRSGAIQITRTGEMKNIGGSMTYARRYTVTMLLGIASEEDTDAGDLTVGEKKQSVVEAAQKLNVTSQLSDLETADSLTELKNVWQEFTPAERQNVELQNKKEEVKNRLEENEEVIQTEPEDSEEPPEDPTEPQVEPEIEKEAAPKKK